MNTKEYKSELGKLYQAKREEAPLQKIVFEIYSLFKFWIESGEMLPINVSAKDYRPFTSTEIMRITVWTVGGENSSQFTFENLSLEDFMEMVKWK